ncbi:MAG: LPS export ABC transporter ATP-binding protein [Proteobacteria bacterium]|jgi:lipopolysaccharide export system ATP-binding protein|nr:LPS export ABC transporter ATP-binding protein [Pseudomonadota bacterium]NCV45500.1 LPS export ABC transporter ATP-binding protein [Pseudomonadota bacterium]NCV99118.1 LPS export ABC transporter ATP-binding protein [Pseudomonadota bacterium]NCW37558.1 LPS export ABC transporter ATP-binding protein [Pseudomonadota bacterium]NCX41959.1 LPS export ABC transporter ATP-binding protein [Pseudomonadota bacterium]
MLSIQNINKTIKDKNIVDNISFEVPSGCISGLLGPNGAGKTTTFYMIAGLIKADKGDIFLADENVSSFAMHKRSKMGIKYLPQEPSIFQNLSVYENLLGLAELSFKRKEDIQNFITKSIDEFNLSEILNHKGRQLSGGQRRKVEIARTLAANPKIILLDEPFAGIDPIAIDEIKQVLIKLKNKNIGILITDHNVREALEICDHAIVINNGSIIAKGDKNSLIKDEMVKKVYLGDMYS